MTYEEFKESLTEDQREAFWDFHLSCGRNERAFAYLQWGERFLKWADARGVEITAEDMKAFSESKGDGAELLEKLRKIMAPA